MPDSSIPALLWSQLCAAHPDVTAGGHGLAGPLIGNILVAGAAGIVTLGCIVVAARMLLHPGELDPNHPKRSILAPDR